MNNLNPFFELNGVRYEIKKTRWLIAEYKRLGESMDISDEDKANATKAGNLIADVKKFAEKEQEYWEALCENPTEENQRIYLMFKGMSDNAISAYNDFAAATNAVQTVLKNNVDILEKIAIKGLAEQYFDQNEAMARETWEKFVDSVESHSQIVEWLNAMADCLFGQEDEVEDNSFLSQKRKMDEARAQNKRNALKKKR